MGAAAIAAAMVIVSYRRLQAAGGRRKRLPFLLKKQLNQALKTVKGKNAVITVKAGKNVKITIPKGTYKVTIRVVGKKSSRCKNNGTVKEIVVNSKGNGCDQEQWYHKESDGTECKKCFLFRKP